MVVTGGKKRKGQVFRNGNNQTIGCKKTKRRNPTERAADETKGTTSSAVW